MQLKQNLWIVVALTAVAAAPGSAAPSTSVPDFSGIWAHQWDPGFEALDSGPTSLINLSRKKDGSANVAQLVGDYHNPILKPEAAETVRKLGEESKLHYGFHNPRNQCWPSGVPFILASNGMQIFNRGDHLTIIYRLDQQIRTVRMNAEHPAKPVPSYYGDSVGHYEGDTLVIDTVALKMGPFAMLDWFGTPQSPGLHVVERYQLLDYDQAKDGIRRAFRDNTINPNGVPPVNDLSWRGKWLQVLFTVDDPNVFTTPWSATVTYGPETTPPKGLGAWPEYVCAENPHKFGTEDDVQVPTAKVADF